MKNMLCLTLLSFAAVNAMYESSEQDAASRYISTICSLKDSLDKVAEAGHIEGVLKSLGNSHDLWKQYGLVALAEASASVVFAEENLRECVRNKVPQDTLQKAKIQYKVAFMNQLLLQNHHKNVTQ